MPIIAGVSCVPLATALRGRSRGRSTSLAARRSSRASAFGRRAVTTGVARFASIKGLAAFSISPALLMNFVAFVYKNVNRGVSQSLWEKGFACEQLRLEAGPLAVVSCYACQPSRQKYKGSRPVK